MVTKKAEKIAEKILQVCTDCGRCQDVCSLLAAGDITPRGIAEQILNGPITSEVVDFVQRCDLCGCCSQKCPLDLDTAELSKAAREILIQKGFIYVDDYDLMRVDREWNFFTLYRDSYGICYDDLSPDDCEALFFPGCTLGSYAPELTRAAFNWLKEDRRLQVGFSDLCCGKPLESTGLTGKADHCLEGLRRQLKEAGAHEIITACPNCEATLKSGLTEVRVRSIGSLMLEAGIRLNGRSTLTFHDSCPERHGVKTGEKIRRLLSGFKQVEMNSRGEDTICCGSGGIVSMIDPELCASRAQQRMAEFTETGAEICVTGCMACAHRLARAGQPRQVTHFLEHVFDMRVDYAQIERNIHAMWEGNQGEKNLLLLAQNNGLCADREDHAVS